MKKIYGVFLSLFFIFGCSNDLDITADYKETTIIYGLLNQNDTVQYIQVFKGFLDDNTSALVLAQNPDSIYYDDSVRVQLNDGNSTFDLERILGPNRAAGVFVDSPNYVYRLPASINQDRTYAITFTNLRTGHVATAQTPIVKDFSITYPPAGLLLNFTALAGVNIQWQSAQNGKIYQMELLFTYEEWNVNNPTEKDTQILRLPIFSNEVASSTQGGEVMNYKINGNDFYRTLENSIEKNANLQRRALDSCLQLNFYVGGEELYNYIRVNSAQTGITSLSIKPEYTNVTGGLGIFSSRYRKVRSNIGLNERSLDSLSCGSFTEDLNFVNSDLCN